MIRRHDLELYDREAERWWASGDRFFRSLRSVGEFHLGLIRREWGARLRGSRLVELGSGGGAMAMALGELGAEVTALDRSPRTVAAARAEAERRGSKSRFVCANLLSCPLPARAFDLAVMADVLEHLETPALAIREASRLLRPGGGLFVNTFDRSWRSRRIVVDLAEGLGLVPRGTHDARLFVRPGELRRYAARSGMRVERVLWERPAIVRTALSWTVHLVEARRGVAFSAFLTKEAA